MDHSIIIGASYTGYFAVQGERSTSMASKYSM